MTLCPLQHLMLIIAIEALLLAAANVPPTWVHSEYYPGQLSMGSLHRPSPIGFDSAVVVSRLPRAKRGEGKHDDPHSVKPNNNTIR